MRPNELIELAKTVSSHKAETQTIEVKAAHGGCPKSIYDTLSSFSNQDGGGTILFGLDEKLGFAPVGVYSLQDLQQEVVDQCNQMVPPVPAVFTTAEYKGALICSAEIPSIDIMERPCYYAGKGKQRGSYVRVGSDDIPMTDYEIYSYEAYRKHLQDDIRAVERTRLDLLDQNTLSIYIHEKKRDKPQFSQFDQQQTYEALNITRDNAITLAAFLMFSPYPQGIFPQLSITAIVVPGTEIGDTDADGARFINNKRIEGSIPAMFTEAMSFCTRNIKTKTIIDSATGQRRDIPEYPITAIREIILNALMHRDYSIHTEGTPIQICFYSNRLEVHSPGGLYGRLTIDQLGHCSPDSRNPALVTMAEVITETENRFSGIPTIRRAMREAGLPQPEFQNRRNEFVAILYNSNSEFSISAQNTNHADAIEHLLEYCKTPRSRDEIAAFMGIKTVHHATAKYITPLLNSNRLKQTLPDKPRSKNQRYYS